jgi:hypothetical protein
MLAAAALVEGRRVLERVAAVAVGEMICLGTFGDDLFFWRWRGGKGSEGKEICGGFSRIGNGRRGEGNWIDDDGGGWVVVMHLFCAEHLF